MTLDVWMSDKAVPTGVVKMSGAGGIEMVLSSTGTGAKAKAEPKRAESMNGDAAERSTRAGRDPEETSDAGQLTRVSRSPGRRARPTRWY